jgi:hypothetical protein
MFQVYSDDGDDDKLFQMHSVNLLFFSKVIMSFDEGGGKQNPVTILEKT